MGRASIGTPKPQGRPRSESAHRAILAAANRLLEQHGFHDLSVEAIAAAAGVTVVGATAAYVLGADPAFAVDILDSLLH